MSKTYINQDNSLIISETITQETIFSIDQLKQELSIWQNNELTAQQEVKRLTDLINEAVKVGVKTKEEIENINKSK